jgi:hypothetical protein
MQEPTPTDVSIWDYVVLDEEYYQDLYQRFGRPLLRYYRKRTTPLLLPIQERAKIMSRGTSIFIPMIEDHLNAFLDQRREQRRTKCYNGGVPDCQIKTTFVIFISTGLLREIGFRALKFEDEI